MTLEALEEERDRIKAAILEIDDEITRIKAQLEHAEVDGDRDPHWAINARTAVRYKNRKLQELQSSLGKVNCEIKVVNAKAFELAVHRRGAKSPSQRDLYGHSDPSFRLKAEKKLPGIRPVARINPVALRGATILKATAMNNIANAEVPESITDEEKSVLRDLGYPENDIINMKPDDAERILYVQRLYGECFPCLKFSCRESRSHCAA